MNVDRRERNGSHATKAGSGEEITCRISSRTETRCVGIRTVQEKKTAPARPPRPKTSLNNLRPKVVLSPAPQIQGPTQLVPSSPIARDHAISFSEDVFAALHPYLHPKTDRDRRLRTWDVEEERYRRGPAGRHEARLAIKTEHDQDEQADESISCHDLDLSIQASQSRSPSSCASHHHRARDCEEKEDEEEGEESSCTSEAWTCRRYFYPEDKHISSWALEEGERKVSWEGHGNCTIIGRPSRPTMTTSSSKDDIDQVTAHTDLEQGGPPSPAWRSWYMRYRRRIWMAVTTLVVLVAAAAITGGIMWRLTRCKFLCTILPQVPTYLVIIIADV